MGDHSGQALPRFLTEDGQVPVHPGESPGSQHGGAYQVLSAGTPSLFSLSTANLIEEAHFWAVNPMNLVHFK